MLYLIIIIVNVNGIILVNQYIKIESIKYLNYKIKLLLEFSCKLKEIRITMINIYRFTSITYGFG